MSLNPDAGSPVREPLSKLKDLPALRETLETLRKEKKKIVFTNGCFDLLHVGHVRYLNEARALGDRLVVGLNSDGSVRKLKGAGRPVTSERERAEVLGALECVDFMVLFTEDTPENVIRGIRPDCLVKGGDWDKKDIVGADFVESYGGVVLSLGLIPDKSTTGMIRTIRGHA